MIQLTETYTWQQAAALSKLNKLDVKLHMISFAIDGKIEDLYLLSQQAAIEGMFYFEKRTKQNWIDKFLKFDFSKLFNI